MPAARGQGPQLGGEPFEIDLGLAAQRLSEDFADLGFRRTPMSRRAALQSGEDIVIEIPHAQAWHGTNSLLPSLPAMMALEYS
jgi:hypothetical protein